MCSLKPLDLLFEERHADIYFEYKSSPQVLIPAHKLVLKSCSRVFAEAFENSTPGMKDGKEEPLPVRAGVSLRSFKIFLSWIYTNCLQNADKAKDKTCATTEAAFDISLADCFDVLDIAGLHEMPDLAALILSRIPQKITASSTDVKILLSRGRLLLNWKDTDALRLLKQRCFFAMDRAFAWLVEQVLATSDSTAITFDEMDFLLARDFLCINEDRLYNFLVIWAQRTLESGSPLSSVIGDLIYNIRIHLMSASTFAVGPGKDMVFSYEETACALLAYNKVRPIVQSDLFEEFRNKIIVKGHRCIAHTFGDQVWRNTILGKTGMGYKLCVCASSQW